MTKNCKKACKKAYILTAAKNNLSFLLTALLLEQVSYINYLLYFKKDQAKFQALINFGNKINIITPAYKQKLGF